MRVQNGEAAGAPNPRLLALLRPPLHPASQARKPPRPCQCTAGAHPRRSWARRPPGPPPATAAAPRRRPSHSPRAFAPPYKCGCQAHSGLCRLLPAPTAPAVACPALARAAEPGQSSKSGSNDGGRAPGPGAPAPLRRQPRHPAAGHRRGVRWAGLPALPPAAAAASGPLRRRLPRRCGAPCCPAQPARRTALPRADMEKKGLRDQLEAQAREIARLQGEWPGRRPRSGACGRGRLAAPAPMDRVGGARPRHKAHAAAPGCRRALAGRSAGRAGWAPAAAAARGHTARHVSPLAPLHLPAAPASAAGPAKLPRRCKHPPQLAGGSRCPAASPQGPAPQRACPPICLPTGTLGAPTLPAPPRRRHAGALPQLGGAAAGAVPAVQPGRRPPRQARLVSAPRGFSVPTRCAGVPAMQLLRWGASSSAGAARATRRHLPGAAGAGGGSWAPPWAAAAACPMLPGRGLEAGAAALALPWPPTRRAPTPLPCSVGNLPGNVSETELRQVRLGWLAGHGPGMGRSQGRCLRAAAPFRGCAPRAVAPRLGRLFPASLLWRSLWLFMPYRSFLTYALLCFPCNPPPPSPRRPSTSSWCRRAAPRPPASPSPPASSTRLAATCLAACRRWPLPGAGQACNCGFSAPAAQRLPRAPTRWLLPLRTARLARAAGPSRRRARPPRRARLHHVPTLPRPPQLHVHRPPRPGAPPRPPPLPRRATVTCCSTVCTRCRTRATRLSSSGRWRRPATPWRSTASSCATRTSRWGAGGGVVGGWGGAALRRAVLRRATPRCAVLSVACWAWTWIVAPFCVPGCAGLRCCCPPAAAMASRLRVPVPAGSRPAHPAQPPVTPSPPLPSPLPTHPSWQQIRRPNNYDITLALMLGPTEPNPTMDVSLPAPAGGEGCPPLGLACVRGGRAGAGAARCTPAGCQPHAACRARCCPRRPAHRAVVPSPEVPASPHRFSPALLPAPACSWRTWRW